MIRATSYEALRAKSKDELVQEYDRVATHTQIGLDYIRAEITRRDAEDEARAMAELNHEMRDVNREMRDMTREMKFLTPVMTVLTAIAAVAAVVVLFKN